MRLKKSLFSPNELPDEKIGRDLGPISFSGRELLSFQNFFLVSVSFGIATVL